MINPTGAITYTIIKGADVFPTLWWSKDDEIVRETVAKQLTTKDHFIAQYLAATGAKIQDTLLVEQRSEDGRTITYWCEPKGMR